MFIYYEGLVIILGLIIGSFLNCLIWRLYQNETIGGRSYCPKCRKTIAWYDNIPVLSFLFLRGRCRHCQQKISWQYPLVEIATSLIFLLIWRLDSSSANFVYLFLRDILIAITLIVVFVYDYRWQLIPINFLWPLAVVIFILNLILGISWISLVLFAIISAGFFLIQYLLTKKKGIGEGDIYLGAFLGIAFPAIANLLLIILIAYAVGALIGLVLMAVQKKKLKSKIALGPFLSLGALVTLIWGGQIIVWYLSLIY